MSARSILKKISKKFSAAAFDEAFDRGEDISRFLDLKKAAIVQRRFPILDGRPARSRGGQAERLAAGDHQDVDQRAVGPIAQNHALRALGAGVGIAARPQQAGCMGLD